MQPQTKKPSVCHVYLDLLDRLSHAPNPKHELDHCQFDQDDGVEAWTSVIFAITVFHKLIDEAPIYSTIINYP